MRARTYFPVPRDGVKTETFSPQNDRTTELTLTFYWPLLYMNVTNLLTLIQSDGTLAMFLFLTSTRYYISYS